MSTVESIENAVEALPPDELAQFRRWFGAFDAAAWDAQLEADAVSGKLDALAQEALAEYQAATAACFEAPRFESLLAVIPKPAAECAGFGAPQRQAPRLTFGLPRLR